MKLIKTNLSILLTMVILTACSTTALAVSDQTLDVAISDTAAYMLKTVEKPQVGSIGGEWVILGLARSGCKVNDSYYQTYYSNVEAYVKECNGVLSDKKYTEYSRIILALTAVGKDPSNVAGYNLLTPLGDYDKTIWQGINGPIFALIALDSDNYKIPINNNAKQQATRDMYVHEILSLQLDDGGFAMSGTSADPNMTAMALQALSKYKDNGNVSTAINKALTCLSVMQNDTGGFFGENENSESVSQAIVALGELEISLDDSRFVKNGYSLMDNLLTYYVKDSGFQHTANIGGSNEMATEQAFYALVSAQRNSKGEKSLYSMSDAISVLDPSGTSLQLGEGLAGKNPDVKAQAIAVPGKTFEDISGTYASKYKTAIEALASRSMIKGYDDGSFRPENTMTRAEFAAVVVRALGLMPKATDVFADVSASSWYVSYVGTANTYGIVKGKSSSLFDPSGTITRQEATVMTARAAKLCGMNTSMTTSEIRDFLAQFDDYVQVADWAKESMAFCYSENILDQSALEIQPSIPITRGEIAQMLFHMISKANLL
jgi:hypothetical protein